ncbi:hypothetical protein KI387_032127, partial [Taxus chinensis]
ACARHISPTLQVQTFRTFDEAFTMARKLEIRAIKEKKIQLQNKNTPFKSNDSSSSSKPQNNYSKPKGSANV